MCMCLYIVGSLTFLSLTLARIEERVSVYYRKRGRERECVRLQDRDRAYRAAEQTTQHAAEQRAAAAEQSTGAAMASRKHERSESR